MHHRLLDVLVLMAVCDGALTEKEREFLKEISERLEVPLDLTEAERKARDYRVAAKSSMPQKMASGIRDTATVACGKAQDIFGEMLGRGSAHRRDPVQTSQLRQRTDRDGAAYCSAHHLLNATTTLGTLGSRSLPLTAV